jgi:hypothetical protein
MMKPKSGRGGARPGAGRKRKAIARAPQPGSAAAELPAPIIPPGLTDEELKKFCATLAYEALAFVAWHGTSENAKVAASRELLDRSLGKPKPAPATKPDQSDFFEDGWGDLLKSRQRSAGRSN